MFIFLSLNTVSLFLLARRSHFCGHLLVNTQRNIPFLVVVSIGRSVAWIMNKSRLVGFAHTVEMKHVYQAQMPQRYLLDQLSERIYTCLLYIYVCKYVHMPLPGIWGKFIPFHPTPAASRPADI